MHKPDLIPPRQKKFVLNQVVTKSTCIKNPEYWLNNLFLQQPTEPYINYVKPQLKSISRLLGPQSRVISINTPSFQLQSQPQRQR